MSAFQVQLDQPIATIDPNVYGHFAEHLGTCIYEGLWVGEDSPIPNTEGIRNDVLEALRRLKPPVVRWPGGCFADTYDWRDGIGPRESRPLRINAHWGQAPEPNTFGTHEFLRLCRLLNTQPYVCGNVGSGTPRELSQWIEYCNFRGDSALTRERAANGSPEPFNVTYWGVGNENWGCGGNMTPEEYATLYRRFATYCFEYSGFPVYLIACGPNGNNVDWTRRFMEQYARRGRLHGFAAHYYCGTAGTATEFTDDEYYTLVRRAWVEMERLIKQQRAALDSYDPERRIGLIIDEWGTWHPADSNRPPRGLWQQNTMRDALVAAGSLDIFNRHADKVVMSNIAQMVNVLQAMCLTDGDKMLCTPTYHVYELYADHQGGRSLVTLTDAEPALSGDVKHGQLDGLAGSASLKGNQLTVTLAQPKLVADEVLVELRGGTPVEATARVLAADDPRAHNTFDEPERVTPRELAVRPEGHHLRLTLPAASVARITVKVS